ncbi:MAG: DUF4124 domain-containing protein [Candidatus Competibacteraceae bacterium]
MSLGKFVARWFMRVADLLILCSRQLEEDVLKRTLLILAISCCWISVQAQQGQQGQQPQQYIYKWVDDQGKAQYSELPPPKGVAYETVRKSTGVTQDPGPSARDPAKEMQEKKAQEEAKLKEQAEQAQHSQKEADDQRAKNCEIAKKNMEVLGSDKPVIKTDAKGNKIALDAQQREAELQKARKDQDYFCNP